MNEVQFISHLKGLNLDQNISKFEKKIKNGMAELINMTNQIKIENFLSGDLSDLLSIDYIDVINSIKRVPARIYSHFTGMNSGIILDWILSILHSPEAFARIVVKYFRNNNKNLSYFSAITFPSLFHHFFTDDFQKLSYQFLISMLESGDIGTFWYFCLSFIESSSNFSIILWSNFLNLNENEDIFFVSNRNSQQNFNQEQPNFQPKIQRSQIFFRFLRCLEIASSALSVYQQKIVKKFSDANAPTCAFFLCKYFIERSFFWFRGNEPDQKDQTSETHNSSPSSSDRSAGVNPFFSTDSFSFKNDSDSTYNETFNHNNLINKLNATYVRSLNEEIIKILEYASLNPKSPQFTAIVNVLTSSRFSRFVPNIVSSHTYFILSQRDCYLIQEIIKKDAEDKEEEQKNQNQNQNDTNVDQKESDSNEKKDNSPNSSEINFVKVFPLTKDSFNNFAPMSIEIPLVNFTKLYSQQKSFNSNTFNSNNDELSLFPVKNDKLQKLLDLIMFDHFIDNEYSKRIYEQARSHFCFASKLLQKNQFVKRKMIDFNSFYGYFQSHNYKAKRHTHSNETNLNKAKKGITSYKSYYVPKTDHFFDIPKLTPLSPEPAPAKCPLSTTTKSDNESSENHEKRNSKRKVVFNEDDQINSARVQSTTGKNDLSRRRSLNIQKSFYDLNPKENRDFGYNNEEFIIKVETEPRKKRLTSNIIESTYQLTISEPNTNKTGTSSNNDSKVSSSNNSSFKENNNEDENSQSSEEEKLSKKKIKRQEKKKKRKERKKKRKEKKEQKKEKKKISKEEKKSQEKNKEEDKEEKKEEKILQKENEKKEKKQKKELLKQKKEEERLKKIRLKKEKRREKMRKNQEKKLRRNSEIVLDGNININGVGDDDDDSDSDIDFFRNNNENKSETSDDSSNVSSNLSLNSNDFKNDQNVSSESAKDNDNENNNDDDTKIESKTSKESGSKKAEQKVVKKSKKKKYHSVHFDNNIRTYFSSSIILTSSSSKEVHPILDNLIPQIENNESKLILYCIKLNDFEFRSRKVDQITAQYVLLLNSQRLRKIKKYLTVHYNWFRAANFLASKIDFMSDFNIGTAIIIFCQLCKYFSPLSSYSQTVLNVLPPSISSSNLCMEANAKKNSSNMILDSPHNSIIEEESFNSKEEKHNNESSSSINRATISKDEFISVYSDTETSLDIYSYVNDSNYENDESSNSNDNSHSNSQSDMNSAKMASVLNTTKNSKEEEAFIFPPALISKDVVNFLRFVLMLSHTDCFIRYFTWITKVLVVFPQIKNIIHQIYGIDVSHLEIAFKTLLSKIDKPLLIEIGKEVFKKYDKMET